MSRGLGRIERAIVAYVERPVMRGVVTWWELQDAIYPKTAWSRAQQVALLRAMNSLARKFPDRYAVAGGKGRIWLFFGRKRSVVRYARRWSNVPVKAPAGVDATHAHAKRKARRSK
jgi:hypothetical protein